MNNNKTEYLLGLLKVKVLRGVNLAVRDVRASDPYVVVRLGQHKLKTHVVKKNLNPEWNEELTLSVVGTVIRKITRDRQNCLADVSSIYWFNGKVLQDVIVRLRNMECGELELQLQWVKVPNSRR